MTTPQRVAAASALRRLNHALVAHDADDQVLERLTAQVEAIMPSITSARRRDRGELILEHVSTIFGATDAPPGPDDPFSVMADRAVGGQSNPTAAEIAVRYEDDEVIATVTLGPAFEGAPGRAHGGIVAALFDDVTGYVLRLAGTPAFTGRLTVTYHAPAPVGSPLEFRSRLTEREARKLHITAQCRHGADLIASADALFVTVDADRFRQLPAATRPRANRDTHLPDAAR
jgi:acyl-coenzyme A thioesterase PaaI-like protein